jgi:hypothetical protein
VESVAVLDDESNSIFEDLSAARSRLYRRLW